MKSKPVLDLTALSTEFNLILEIVTSGEQSRKKVTRNSDIPSDIDWDLFIELAMHHRIFPILYSKLNKSSEYIVPLNVLQILKQAYTSNTFEMLRLTAEMNLLNKICGDNKIPLLFLKGPVLANELYGDLSLRTSCDLDIMIPFKALKKMENLLIDHGYRKDDYILSVLGDWKWRHHHITFIHPEKELKIEVHWRLNPGPGDEPSFDDLWNRKRASSLLEEPVFYLGVEDLFYFLVTHGARHGWSRLRWLTDIDYLLKQTKDWSSLSSSLKKYNCHHIGAQALILSSELLNSESSKELALMLNNSRSVRLAQQAIFYLKEMINLHSEQLPKDVSEYHKNHLFELMSVKQKIIFLLSFIYPYHTDLETMPLPKYLHFLYFPLRPILCIWRKTKNHALQ